MQRFFDDGGVVDTANDINNVGVTFEGRVDVDPINDGDVDDEVNTAMFPFRCLVDLPC